MILPILLLVVTLAAADHTKRSCNIFGGKYHGHATYYGKGADAGNACGLRNPEPWLRSHQGFRYTVAINSPDYAETYGCGLCYRVHGLNHGNGMPSSNLNDTFYVYGNNWCPECVEGTLDIADDGDGVWDIDIEPVQCPVGNHEIMYQFEGTNPYYYKFQTRNERVPVSVMQVWDGGMWNEARRQQGFWVYMPKTPNGGDIKIRYGSYVNGQILEDLVPMKDKGEQAGKNGVQFTFDSSLDFMPDDYKD